MTHYYIDSVDILKSKYPHFTPLEGGKNRSYKGQKYAKIGVQKKSHGSLWQSSRSIMALGATALSLLIVPLAFKKYRISTGRLWKEAFLGSEKISLYFNQGCDPASLQTYLARKKVLDLVRKNGDNYTQLEAKYRDDEEILLEAIKNTFSNLLPHASEKLQASRTIALALVGKKGDHFEHLSNIFRDDEEIFHAASYTTNTNLLPFASPRLQESQSLAIALVTKFGPNYERLTEKMKKEKEVALATCKYYDRVNDLLNREQNSNLTSYAQENLAKLCSIYDQFPTELKNDSDIKASYKKNKRALKSYIKRPQPIIQYVTVQPRPAYPEFIYHPAPVFIPTPIFPPIYSPPPIRTGPFHNYVSRPIRHHHHVPVGTRRF